MVRRISGQSEEIDKQTASARKQAAEADSSNGTTDPEELSLEQLTGVAVSIRRDIVNMVAKAGSGHCGGSLSAVEILLTLYSKIMRHNPANPSWAGRDMFILSKAHACPVLYATLAYFGYFSRDHLWTFRAINSLLQGHAHIMTPGVEMSGGSLGQGLSFGIGNALSSRLDGVDTRTHVLLGDGECDEGQVWEAAMSASHYRLDNLVAIVDRNGIQNDRWTSETMNLEPFAEKWRSFGWHVIEADGHNLEGLNNAFTEAKEVKGKPTVVIAATVKGKGVSFMENNPGFHGKAPNEEQLAKALEELSI